MSGKGRRSGRQRRQRRRVPAEPEYPDWADVGGRLMFVAGYTPGGAPYGIFADEMDDDAGDDAGPVLRPRG